MFRSTLLIIKNAWVTEGPPIKTPSGPCWPPDEHMPRMHHVGAVQSHLTPPPLLPLHTAVTLGLPDAPSLKQTEKKHSITFFFCLCWQSNEANDEPRPLATSVWAQWETVADGGVGMWINRLAGHLTDGIYRRPRRQRIHFSRRTCLCQVHSS